MYIYFIVNLYIHIDICVHVKMHYLNKLKRKYSTLSKVNKRMPKLSKLFFVLSIICKCNTFQSVYITEPFAVCYSYMWCDEGMIYNAVMKILVVSSDINNSGWLLLSIQNLKDDGQGYNLLLWRYWRPSFSPFSKILEDKLCNLCSFVVRKHIVNRSSP